MDVAVAPIILIADVFPALTPVGVAFPETGAFPPVVAAGVDAGPLAPTAFVGVVVAAGLGYWTFGSGGTCGAGGPLAGTAVLAGSGYAGVLFEAAVVGFPWVAVAVGVGEGDGPFLFIY